ncbi:MAG: hypothetical protein G01um101466_85 [Parcubacteria group bacterium Gr01-1014_66]|nr:MAG: hypothetical protein G01um101466_85 [Parcubacteria group bacterium Gr01-1014_66]
MAYGNIPPPPIERELTHVSLGGQNGNYKLVIGPIAPHTPLAVGVDPIDVEGPAISVTRTETDDNGNYEQNITFTQPSANIWVSVRGYRKKELNACAGPVKSQLIPAKTAIPRDIQKRNTVIAWLAGRLDGMRERESRGIRLATQHRLLRGLMRRRILIPTLMYLSAFSVSIALLRIFDPSADPFSLWVPVLLCGPLAACAFLLHPQFMRAWGYQHGWRFATDNNVRLRTWMFGNGLGFIGLLILLIMGPIMSASPLSEQDAFLVQLRIEHGLSSTDSQSPFPWFWLFGGICLASFIGSICYIPIVLKDEFERA